MKHTLEYLVLLATICIVINGERADISTLRQAHIVFNTGERSQINTFPNDIHTASDWPMGYNQLTTAGKYQMLNLGKFLKERYVGFIKESYQESELRVLSFDKDIFVMSAQLMLAGMYSAHSSKLDTNVLPWQPVPVFTLPKNLNYMFNMSHPCKKYDDYLTAAMSSSGATDFFHTHKDTIDRLYKLGGWTLTTSTSLGDKFEAVLSMYDPLICQAEYNMTLPTWATPSVMEDLQFLQTQYYAIKYAIPKMTVIRGGPFLGQIINDTRFAVNVARESLPKISMYTGTSDTLVAILNALKVWDNTIPSAAAAVMIELHEVLPGEYYLAIFYETVSEYNEAPKQCVVLMLNGCGQYCPLDHFVKLTKDTTYTGPFSTWSSMCEERILFDIPPVGGIIAGLIVGVILLICLFVIIAFICSIKKKLSMAKIFGEA